MSRILLGCLLVVLSLLPAQAAKLIVKKDGTALWVSSARMDSDTLYYQTRAEERELTIPRAQVDRVLPSLDPGKPTTTDEVDRVLKAIDEVNKKYPAIIKDTGILLDQWRKAQKRHSSITPEDKARMEAQIARAVARWTVSPRTTEAYSSLISELGILRYSDVNSDFKAELDQLETAMKRDYLELNGKRLAALAGNDRVTFANWLSIRALAGEMAGVQPPPETAAEIKAILTYARTQTFASERDGALALAGARPSLGQYLSAATRAFRLAAEVVDDGLKPELAKLFQELQGRLHASHPEYNLGFKGCESFPLTEDEQAILADPAVPRARGTNDEAPADPAALLFLLEAPKEWRYDQDLKIATRVAFNRTPPGDGQYRLVARLANVAGQGAPLPDLKLGEGRALLNATFSFTAIKVEDLAAARRQAATPAANGYATMTVRLEIGRPGAKPKEIIWTPLSLWMPIPILVP